MNSVATRIAPKTSAVPRSGCSRTRRNGGPARMPAPIIVQSDPSRPIAAAEVVREHDDHQDLGQLAELELQPEDRDPARRATDTAADRERHDEQAELDQVQRPRERLQPVVVEGGRDEEHRNRDRGPHQGAEEHRAAIEDADRRRSRRCCTPSPDRRTAAARRRSPAGGRMRATRRSRARRSSGTAGSSGR